MRLRDTLSHTVAASALLLALAFPAAAQAPAAPLAAPSAAPAAGDAEVPGVKDMAAHRAAYRLTLNKARPNSDVTQAEGAMLFEVVDACDGWATRQRLTLNVTDKAGDQVETSSDYSTYESKDGKHLRFTLTQMAQGAVTQRVAGEATLDGDRGGAVQYEQPNQDKVALPPGTLLPMMHTIRTLGLAKAGQRMLVTPLFDGTNDDGAQDSTSILSGWTAPMANPRFPLLANQASARMRIAFFGKDAGAGASAPEYEVGLRYFANGVADEMNMDFGEFAVDGKMESLEALPARCG
jgi:hypothetical protein